MENVKDVESESGQLDCLDVPQETGWESLPVVVLREIVQNLSNATCLRLSRVNKVWNYETQSVLRDRGSLTAKMNTDDGTCKDLRAFASDLRRMREVRKVVPFSGLTMAVSGAEEQHGDWCQESSIGELDQVYEDILHQMEWRHLAIDLTDDWNQKESCALFQLLQKILNNCSDQLEELSLKIASDHEVFIQNFLQDCNFSRLKTLKFTGQCNDEDEELEYGCCGEEENVIKSLVSRAPNLKVLSTKGLVNLKGNLLEGRISVVHMTDHPYCLPRDALNIPESTLGQLRLRKIELNTDGDFTLERFNIMVPIVLQNSLTILRSMEVEAVLLVPLIHCGICMENVRVLTVAFYDCLTPQPRLWQLLKSLDFTHIFPNLRTVSIDCYEVYFENTSNVVMDVVEQGNAGLVEYANQNVNIKDLALRWSPSTPDFFMRCLVQMFPHIERLLILTISSSVLSTLLWDCWLDLEKLEITMRFGVEVFENFNYDSVFCGIFPEEAAELGQRDEEYLQKVNIVPVMPSLACLKRLKILDVFFDDEEDFYRGDPSYILSKVTGLIAFKRCPDLKVILATSSDRWKRELQHMEPYASVRLSR